MKKTETHPKNVLGANIKKYRRQLKITQEQLAERLDVSRQAVSKWECGEDKPSTANLISLAAVFNVTVEQLTAACENDENKLNNKFSLFVKSHKTLTVIAAILLSLAIIICALAVHDMRYYSGIFYVTQEQMDDFIGNQEGVNEYEIPPYPPIWEETDDFVRACCTQYFNTSLLEDTRITDALFSDKNGRYLIMCFDTDEKYPAKQVFEDLTLGHKTAKFKRPFLTFFKSAYAEQYYMESASQPFIQVWYNGNRLVLMVSENKESATHIMKKILTYQD